MVADKPRLNTHPVFKDYDRLFFDENGDLVPSTLNICKDGSWIRLTNISLDFDHAAGRKVMCDEGTKPPLSPLLTVYEGSGSFLDYSYTVECADTDHPITYVLIIHSDGIKVSYYGGMTKMALRKGIWEPITQLEFNDYSDWLQDSMQTDVPFEYWLQRIQNNGKGRCLKTASDIIFEASSQHDKDNFVKFELRPDEAEIKPVVEAPTEPKAPPIVLESGYTIDIGANQVHAEKVPVDG